MLAGIETFVAVAEAESFTKAAERLGKSLSFVSKEIARLERQLGARLFNRTTRSVALTEDGRLYFEECRQVLAAAEEAARAFRDSRTTPRGRLKISAPVSLGLSHLTYILPDFLKHWPEISIDVELTDGFVDVVGGGYDLVLRYGHLEDSGLIARKLSNFRGLLVASPAYWKSHGRPKKPADLAGRDAICFARMRNHDKWSFDSGRRKPEVVRVNPRVVCDSAELELAFAIAGFGIARLPEFVCTQALAKGELEAALERFEGEPRGLHAVYPHRDYVPAKTRALIEYLAEAFAEQ